MYVTKNIRKPLIYLNFAIRLNRNIHRYKIKDVEAKNKIEEFSFKIHKLTLDLEYSKEKYSDLAIRFVSILIFECFKCMVYICCKLNLSLFCLGGKGRRIKAQKLF